MNIASSTAPLPAPRLQSSYSRAIDALLAFVACALATGILTNEYSYGIALLIAIVCLTIRQPEKTRWKRFIISLSILTIMFGGVNGYISGYDPKHITRFVFPLSIFTIFVSFSGVFESIFRSRKIILYSMFILTSIFYYVVKSGQFDLAEQFMMGWTLTYSSNAGVSVWHFFCIPFCLVTICEALHNPKSVADLVRGILASIVLLMLYSLTDTSSFSLAIFVILLMYFVPRRLIKIAGWPVFTTICVVVIDFMTFQAFADVALSTIGVLADNDSGDLIRFVQLEYFYRNATFIGSGFGAPHDFPFYSSAMRQQSQIILPYASELPIANIIFTGGIAAAFWFLMLVYVIFFLCVDQSKLPGSERGRHQFAIACSGILVGSISNPYLFAPASMFLLALLVDGFEWVQKARWSS